MDNFNKEQRSQQKPKFSFNPNWIKDKIDRSADEFAEKFGSYLKEENLTSSQIRNIFGEIKSIQVRVKTGDDFKNEMGNFILSKAKMAYAEGRNNSPGLSEFRKIFDLAHKEVNDRESFERFVAFITAILAYHRAAGGK